MAGLRELNKNSRGIGDIFAVAPFSFATFDGVTRLPPYEVCVAACEHSGHFVIHVEDGGSRISAGGVEVRNKVTFPALFSNDGVVCNFCWETIWIANDEE